MKMKIEKVSHILAVWKAGITKFLFPDFLVSELDPVKILEDRGHLLPPIREQYRPQMDALVDKILDSDVPASIWSRLRKVDPMLMALYFDRVQAATHALEKLSSPEKPEYGQFPDSWHALSRLLLMQKPFQ